MRIGDRRLWLVVGMVDNCGCCFMDSVASWMIASAVNHNRSWIMVNDDSWVVVMHYNIRLVVNNDIRSTIDVDLFFDKLVSEHIL